MYDKIKGLIILVLILFCISAYNSETTRYYTTVSEDADIKLLDSCVTLKDDVSSSSITAINKEIKYLPTKLWKRYLLENGTIEVTSEYSVEDGEKTVGSFNRIGDSEYEIVINEDYIPYSLCHEFSHYLYFVTDASSQTGYQEMLSEKPALWSDLLQSNEYFSTKTEYFAEVGKYYFKGCIDRNKYPKTVSFFDNLTSQFQ